MRNVIVYYSQGGNTDFAAKAIAAALEADTLRIEPVRAYPSAGFRKFFWGGKSAVMAERPKLRPYDFHPEAYDRIILGFPVWAGNVTPPLRTFVQENLAALQGRRVAAFACQSGAGAEKALGKLKACLGVPRLEAELVLIDPKDRPSAANEAKLRAFCEGLSRGDGDA